MCVSIFEYEGVCECLCMCGSVSGSERVSMCEGVFVGVCMCLFICDSVSLRVCECCKCVCMYV